MISTNYFGTVPMVPELTKIDFFSGDDDVTSLDVPTMYFDGWRELYEEEPGYDWTMDSVIVAKGNNVVKFTEVTCNEMLLKCEDSESRWISGVTANAVGADITEREGIRVLKKYFVEEYDFEKCEKKRGKVVFEESSPMDEYELSEFGKFCPANSH